VSKDLIPILLVAVLLCSSAVSFAREPAGGRTGEKKFLLGDIEFSESQTGNKEYSLQVLKGGRQVLSQECAFRVHAPQVFAGIPLPQCRSLVAYCFSGGAHCCMTIIIATSCSSQKTITSIDLAHSNSGVKFVDAGENGAMNLKVADWQFAYYGVDDSDLQLSFADSPAMTRLLVFDGGKWRADRIGEFSRFYSRLFRQAAREAEVASRKNNPEPVAGRAIRAAYYRLMSGKPAEEATESLNRLLPSSWKPESAKIIDDIKRAAFEFNPVEIVE
jgi:hypothetical protein